MNPYFLHLNGEQAGPYSIEKIRFLLRTGQATMSTLYWQDGLAEWIPLSTISDELENQRPSRALAQQLPPQSLPAPSGRKIFYSVFFAILAAAAVIIGFLAAKSRLDAWHRSIEACYAQVGAMHDVSSEVGRRALGGGWERNLEALDVMAQAGARMDEATRALVSVLEKKPFWLPLSISENGSLMDAKAAVKAADDAARKRKADDAEYEAKKRP